MCKYFYHIFFLSLIGFNGVFTSIAIGQDLETFDKKNPIKVSGGINATQTFYHSWGIQNRRDPYYWLLNANLNIRLFNIIDVPLSASFSQQNKSFTQPYNQFGISPKYKAVTVHAGYRNMQFSNFTLGGNLFLGGGIDIAPENSIVMVSAMYGRFTKAISVAETEGVISGTPAFERWGYGTKVTLGRRPMQHGVDLIMFHGKDNYTSIPSKVADSFNLKPAENLVLGLVTRQTIGDKVNFDLEYSFSAYTQDIRMGKEEVENFRLSNNIGGLFTSNVSTQFNKAILGNIIYNSKYYQLKFSYRRIDPEYKTMGSVFLNNDIEDITGNIGWRMFKNRLNMMTGGGVQRNNLDNNLASQMKRIIGQVTFNYAVSRKLNLNGSYSNFTANTRINNTRISANQLGLNQNVDSLAYNQVTSSASGGINFNTGSEKVKHSLFTNGNYQKANDNHGSSSTFYNFTSGYQHAFLPITLNVTLSFTYNNSFIKEITSRSLGPNFALSKQLFQKKVRSSIAVTYLQTYSNDVLTGTNSMIRFSNAYKRGKHHGVGMDVTYMTRKISSGAGNSFSEFRGNLVYNYSF